MATSTVSARATRVGSWLGATLGVLLIPKCPLCVAAALYFLGMSATGAALAAPVIRPFLLAACVVLGALLVRAERRARARRKQATLPPVTASRVPRTPARPGACDCAR